MARISKADAFAQIDAAARAIKSADQAHDGIVSRADMKTEMQTQAEVGAKVLEQVAQDGFMRHRLPQAEQMAATERALAETFYRFIDHRDAKKGARITNSDIDKAVEYAKEKPIAKYDTNNNGLSNDEIAQMKEIGQLASSLVKQTKALEKTQSFLMSRIDDFAGKADALQSAVSAGNWDAVYAMFDPEVRKVQEELGVGRDQFILEALLEPGSGVTSLDDVKGIQLNYVTGLMPYGPDAAMVVGKVTLKDGSEAKASVLLNDPADGMLSFTSAVG